METDVTGQLQIFLFSLGKWSCEMGTGNWEPGCLPDVFHKFVGHFRRALRETDNCQGWMLTDLVT